MPQSISSQQFGNQSQSINMGLSGMSYNTRTNPNMGKSVSMPNGGIADFTQAQPAVTQSMRSFRAAQSAPNVGGVNKNLGQLVKHPMGGTIDFTQAKMAPKKAPMSSTTPTPPGVR
jgi:hypothetical protein